MLSADFEPRLTAVSTSPYEQTENSPLLLACLLSLGHVLQVNTLRSTKREQSKRTCSSTPMNIRTCMRTLMCTHTHAHKQSHALETLAPGSPVLLSGHHDVTGTLLSFQLGTWLLHNNFGRRACTRLVVDHKSLCEPQASQTRCMSSLCSVHVVHTHTAPPLLAKSAHSCLSFSVCF